MVDVLGRRPYTETVEEATFLLSLGESVDQIARTLNMSHAAIARAMRKAGVDDVTVDLFAKRGAYLHHEFPRTTRRALAA